MFTNIARIKIFLRSLQGTRIYKKLEQQNMRIEVLMLRTQSSRRQSFQKMKVFKLIRSLLFSLKKLKLRKTNSTLKEISRLKIHRKDFESPTLNL